MFSLLSFKLASSVVGSDKGTEMSGLLDWNMGVCMLSESREGGWGDGSVRKAVAQFGSLAPTPKLSMVVAPVIPVFRRLRQEDLGGSQARESSQSVNPVKDPISTIEWKPILEVQTFNS